LAQYEHLPIYKAAFALLVNRDKIVKTSPVFTLVLAENATLLFEFWQNS